eukprot:GHVU01054097.1.p1 GENE.GHVU01054097.1~~GHVU01054097.1.p1  ORF type:complete len:224 (+),score=32.68 GHVU01054097.1:795-1466(+)
MAQLQRLHGDPNRIGPPAPRPRDEYCYGENPPALQRRQHREHEAAPTGATSSRQYLPSSNVIPAAYPTVDPASSSSWYGAPRPPTSPSGSLQTAEQQPQPPPSSSSQEPALPYQGLQYYYNQQRQQQEQQPAALQCRHLPQRTLHPYRKLRDDSPLPPVETPEEMTRMRHFLYDAIFETARRSTAWSEWRDNVTWHISKERSIVTTVVRGNCEDGVEHTFIGV